MIGDGSDLSLRVANCFREKNFKVVYYSSDKLFCDQALKEKFAKSTYYKIIYFFNLVGNKHSLSQAKRILAHRHEPTLILTRFDTPVEQDLPRTHQWFTDTITQYQNISDLAEKFPKSSILIAHDVILNDFAWHPAQSFFFSRRDEGQILSPGFGFSFVSQDNFINYIQPLLFSPFDGEKMMLVTNKIAAKSIFAALSEVTLPKYQIITTKLNLAEFEFPFPLVIYSGLSDLNFVRYDHRFFTLLHPPQPNAKKAIAKTPANRSGNLPALKKLIALSMPPSSYSHKKILSQAKAILTRREEGFLRRYASAEAVQGRIPINLKHFDFLPITKAFQAKKALEINFTPPSFKQLRIPPVVIPVQAPQSLNVGKEIINLPVVTQASTASVVVKKAPATKNLLKRKKLYRAWRRKKYLAFLPKIVLLGLIPLLLVGGGVSWYFYWRSHQTQYALQNFFATCSSGNNCLQAGVTAFSHVEELPPTALKDFLLSVQQYALAQQALDKQVAAVGSYLWQNNQLNGSECLSALSAAFSQAQQAYIKLQSQWEDKQAELITLTTEITELERNNFAKYLLSANKNLTLLEKNLPLLTNLLEREAVSTAAILFDSYALRQGGGTIYGYALKKIAPGVKELKVYDVARVASDSAIKINLPEKLAKQDVISNSDASGLANLAFERSFADTAALSGQVLTSALGAKIDLFLGVSFTASSRLTTVLSGEATKETLQKLQQQVAYSRGREVGLISHLNAANTALAVANQETILSKYFYEFLSLLSEGEILLYSSDDELAKQISSLHYGADLDDINCPTSFGTKTCFLDIVSQHDNYLQANSLLTQTVSHTVELTPAATTHVRKIVFDNTKSQQAALDYLSFSLPHTARVEALVVDEVREKLDQNQGVMLTIPAGESSVVSLTFTIQRDISENDLTYSFYQQHQFGLSGQKTQVIINNRLPYAQKIIAPSAINEQKSIIFNPQIDKSFQGAVVF